MTSKYFEDLAITCRDMAKQAGDDGYSAVFNDLACMFEEIAEDTRARRLMLLAEDTAIETGVTVVLHRQRRAHLQLSEPLRDQPRGWHSLIAATKWSGLVSWIGSSVSVIFLAAGAARSSIPSIPDCRDSAPNPDHTKNKPSNWALVSTGFQKEALPEASGNRSHHEHASFS